MKKLIKKIETKVDTMVDEFAEMPEDEFFKRLIVAELAATGLIFTVASWCGAVIPVKWRPMWSGWFWRKNPEHRNR